MLLVIDISSLLRLELLVIVVTVGCSVNRVRMLLHLVETDRRVILSFFSSSRPSRPLANGATGFPCCKTVTPRTRIVLNRALMIPWYISSRIMIPRALPIHIVLILVLKIDTYPINSCCGTRLHRIGLVQIGSLFLLLALLLRIVKQLYWLLFVLGVLTKLIILDFLVRRLSRSVDVGD